MKKNILMRTNLLVCLIIIVGFLLTAVLSYRANYSASLQNIEEVSSLTSEGIYYQMATTFTKPVNVSLTMANDSLLREYLSGEGEHLDDPSYIGTLSKYLGAYQRKYDYDAVFLISTRTGRYYNFNGLDRVLDPGDPENVWYYELLQSPEDYAMNVDNDEVEGAENRITVFVNCKIHDESGEVIGVVGVGMRITSLQAVLQGYEDKFGVGASWSTGTARSRSPPNTPATRRSTSSTSPTTATGSGGRSSPGRRRAWRAASGSPAARGSRRPTTWSRATCPNWSGTWW